MTTSIEKFIRPTLANFGAYSPSKSSHVLAKELGIPVEDIIKLDDNENPYGCSPRVLKALANCDYFQTYPDAGQDELREQLQEYTGMDARYIVAGNGSDGLISNILELFIDPGDKVIHFIPSFDIFRVRTLLYGGELTYIPRNTEYAVDVKAAKKAIDSRTKLIVLVTPNNPTGTITPRKDILELIDIGLPIVIDEAYYEFSRETVAPLVKERDNLMVTRTFSKWAGIAGLRVGYGIFPLKIAEFLHKIKEPYNVNVAARIAVKESLADRKYLMATVERIIAERERMFSELGKTGFLKPFPSKTNFILCAVTRGKASEIQQKLQKRGILVRYFNLPMMDNAIRVSIGKPEHTDALMKGLREIGKEL